MLCKTWTCRCPPRWASSTWQPPPLCRMWTHQPSPPPGCLQLTQSHSLLLLLLFRLNLRPCRFELKHLNFWSNSLAQVDPPAPKAEKPAAEEAGESWEDKADMSSAATTPDDEENSMEDDSGENWASNQLRIAITNTYSLFHSPTSRWWGWKRFLTVCSLAL